MKKIMIIAGGTGGHIFPALAVAEELKRQGFAVVWLGAHYGLEAKIIPQYFPLELIKVEGLRRRGWLAKLTAPWQILSSVMKAMQVMRRLKPDVVLAMGGYVAGPGGVAARISGVPLVIHEQNAKAGFTNRLLAKIAHTRFQAFSTAFKESAVTVGNPIRAALRQIEAPAVRYARQGPLRLLIVGGSQGARAINQCMIEVWQNFAEKNAIEIWHQTGELDFVEMQKAYQQLALPARVEPFIENMAEAYAWADLVISRAGAMSVSEIAAVGVASILIPFPYAVDDHQRYNAQYLACQEAAILLDQKQLTGTEVSRLLLYFIKDKQRLLNMALSANKLAFLDAAEKVARECVKYAQ